MIVVVEKEVAENRLHRKSRGDICARNCTIKAYNTNCVLMHEARSNKDSNTLNIRQLRYNVVNVCVTLPLFFTV